MKGQRLSIILTVQSFLYPLGWVFLEEDSHFTWYHCLMHNSAVEHWYLVNCKHFSPKYSCCKSFFQHLPQMHASSHDSLSDRAMTQGCLLLKTVWEDGRKGLRGQGSGPLTSARSCWGVKKQVGVFWKVSAVRNGDDKGADNTVIWPVSDSWHRTHNHKATTGEKRTVRLFVYRSEPLTWGQLVCFVIVLCSFWHGSLNNCTLILDWMP